jgi:hypothetical protein
MRNSDPEINISILNRSVKMIINLKHLLKTEELANAQKITNNYGNILRN